VKRDSLLHDLKTRCSLLAESPRRGAEAILVSGSASSHAESAGSRQTDLFTALRARASAQKYMPSIEMPFSRLQCRAPTRMDRARGTMFKARAAGLVALLFAMTKPAFADPPRDIDALVNRAMQLSGVPGMAVATVEHGQVTLARVRR
jgi:hypothetical protein